MEIIVGLERKLSVPIGVADRIGFITKPGYSGAFLDTDAPNAYERGTRVRKVYSEAGDTTRDGTLGTIMGSISHPDVWDGTIGYFVSWDSDSDKIIGVTEMKVERAD